MQSPTMQSVTTSLSLRLGLASALIVCAVIGVVATFAYRGERELLLDSMRQAASTQADLTLTGVKFAMLENNYALMTDLFASYVEAPEVEQIFLVDAAGVAKLGTSIAPGSRPAGLESVLCPDCDVDAIDPRTRTFILDQGGRTVLRALTPVRNAPVCHRCHPAEQHLLGVLGVDLSTAPLQRAWRAMITNTITWSAVMGILVLLGVGAIVQLGALRRLRTVRDAAQSLAPRVAQRSGLLWGRDEISELAGDIEAASSRLQDSRAEADLQRQLLADLINGIDDGIAVFDRDLTVVTLNRAYAARVAKSELDPGEGRLSCRGEGLCRHRDAAKSCPTVEAFRTGRLQKQIVKHTGGDRDISYEVFSSPITNVAGRVDHVVEVWRDITERLSVEASLAHSEQLAAVGVLASGFSHEIATPLGTIATSIQGMLRRLRDRDHLGAQEVEALRQRLEVASTEVFRCREILQSLLGLSRDHRTVPDQVPVDAVIARMIEVVRPSAEQAQIKIEAAIAPQLPRVYGHADQLERLCLNLFINAIEAMPRGGALRVAATPLAGAVQLTVTDTGIGIPAADLERVFEPFFSAKKGGTGLGLYLSRQIVDEHGGTIAASSTVGAGTCFTISIPRFAQSDELVQIAAVREGTA